MKFDSLKSQRNIDKDSYFALKLIIGNFVSALKASLFLNYSWHKIKFIAIDRFSCCVDIK